MRKLISQFFLIKSRQYSESGIEKMAIFKPGTYGYSLGAFHSAVSELCRSLAEAFHGIDD